MVRDLGLGITFIKHECKQSEYTYDEMLNALLHGKLFTFFEYNYDGCTYNTLTDVLQCGVLNLCGCGIPDDNVKYIADGLKLIGKLKDVKEEKIKYEDWAKLIKGYFTNSQTEYFFYYMMDNLGLTEHGYSIPGWLTDKGKKFIELYEIGASDDEFELAQNYGTEINPNNYCHKCSKVHQEDSCPVCSAKQQEQKE